MSTIKFDAVPTDAERLTVNEIEPASIQAAWKDYEAKPEYKKVNKHDLIENLISTSSDKDQK